MLFKILGQLIEKKGGCEVFKKPVKKPKTRPVLDMTIYEPKRSVPPPPKSKIKDQDVLKGLEETQKLSSSYLSSLSLPPPPPLPPFPPPLPPPLLPTTLRPILLDNQDRKLEGQNPSISLNSDNKRTCLMNDIKIGFTLKPKSNRTVTVEKPLPKKTMAEALNDALDNYKKIMSKNIIIKNKSNINILIILNLIKDSEWDDQNKGKNLIIML